MRKYGILVLLILSMTLLMTACNGSDGNIGTKVENTTNVETPNTQKNREKENNNSEQRLEDFVLKFVKAIKNNEHKAFIDMVGDGGIISINYFVDKRDPTTVIHVAKDKIRDDLVLVNPQNRAGVTMQTLLADITESDLNEMPVTSSNISFNVDWHSKDERKIADEVEDIVRTCQQINLINNKYIPQVFLLKNNYYAFVIGSGVTEPEVEFVGNWVVFEKIGNEYKIQSVIQLQ